MSAMTPEWTKEKGLTFEQLAQANRARLRQWHKGVQWTVTDWSNAMAGEAGEVCNAVKKLRRIETGTIGQSGPHTREEAIHDIAMEVADTLIYLDLLAACLGFNLSEAVVEKFNSVSVREGFPQRLLDSEAEGLSLKELARAFKCLCGSTKTVTLCESCGERWFMPGQMTAYQAQTARADDHLRREVEGLRNRVAAAIAASLPGSPNTLRTDGHWFANTLSMLDKALCAHEQEES